VPTLSPKRQPSLLAADSAALRVAGELKWPPSITARFERAR
jgi:hypothetical protein